MNQTDKIVKWFLSDTIELLDLKLSDSDTDPQYSAITTLERLRLYLEYTRDCPADDKDVYEYLSECGYCDADIERFKHLCLDEKERYNDN